MNIFRILFELFILYMLYKLIFDFIIPVYKTTRRVKKQFTEMQQKMEEKQRQQEYQNGNFQKSNTQSTASKADYIDYEEIK